MPRLKTFFLCFWQAECSSMQLLFSTVKFESTIEMTCILDFCRVLGETRYIEVKMHTRCAKCIQFGGSALGTLSCSLHR